MIAGIDWVTRNAVKPAVANMSLGGSANQALDDAVRRSIASGVTFSVPAGSSASQAGNFSPARVAEAITSAAIDRSDGGSRSSNYGPLVPGVGIISPRNVTAKATEPRCRRQRHVTRHRHRSRPRSRPRPVGECATCRRTPPTESSTPDTEDGRRSAAEHHCPAAVRVIDLARTRVLLRHFSPLGPVPCPPVQGTQGEDLSCHQADATFDAGCP